MNDFIRIEDKILTYQDNGLLSGMIVSELPTKNHNELVLNYKGGKISVELWNQVKSFLQYTYSISGGEGQIRLFYNVSNNTWKAHPFEQFVSSGLSTEEKKDSDLSRKVTETLLGEGYICNGTVHHHCNIGAFQSGTDWNDERKQTGLHITLGKLNDPVYDYHSRAVFRGVCYKIIDIEWFEDIDNSKVDDTLFPPEWKNYVVEKPKPVVQTWGGWGGYRDSYFENHYGVIDYIRPDRTKKVESKDIPSVPADSCDEDIKVISEDLFENIISKEFEGYNRNLAGEEIEYRMSNVFSNISSSELFTIEPDSISQLVYLMAELLELKNGEKIIDDLFNVALVITENGEKLSPYMRIIDNIHQSLMEASLELDNNDMEDIL